MSGTVNIGRRSSLAKEVLLPCQHFSIPFCELSGISQVKIIMIFASVCCHVECKIYELNAFGFSMILEKLLKMASHSRDLMEISSATLLS